MYIVVDNLTCSHILCRSHMSSSCGLLPDSDLVSLVAVHQASVFPTLRCEYVVCQFDCNRILVVSMSWFPKLIITNKELVHWF